MLAFIAAERRELEGLLQHAEDIRKPDWPVDFARQARLNGKHVALLANGPGPRLAGQAADVVKGQGMGIDALVSIGFCGALEPGLQVCDIFVATEVLGAGPALPPSGSPRTYQTGKLLSLDRVAVSVSEKTGLRASGAAAVEMEAAAVAARAREWNVPFYAIRVVSDTAAESLPLDFNRLRDNQGRFSRARILAAAARHPFRLVPKLVKLNKRSKCAAKALGDFIADARF